jgi:hypothetical protein
MSQQVDQAPWAPASMNASTSEAGSSASHHRFRPDRALCEDGFCLGVLRLTDDSTPYRSGPEGVCPVCGRRFPLATPPPRFASRA